MRWAASLPSLKLVLEERRLMALRLRNFRLTLIQWRKPRENGKIRLKTYTPKNGEMKLSKVFAGKILPTNMKKLRQIKPKK